MAFTNIMASAITKSSAIISKRNLIKPPPSAPLNAVTNSATKALGIRAMIPIIMISDTPLPTPLSVILSPSHRTNILPAARIIVDDNMNQNPSPTRNAPEPAVCALRLIKYEGAWKSKIAIVNQRVI